MAGKAPTVVLRSTRVEAPTTFASVHVRRKRRGAVPSRPSVTKASDGQYTHAEREAIARMRKELAGGRDLTHFRRIDQLTAIGVVTLSRRLRALIDCDSRPWRCLDVLLHDDYTRRLNQIRTAQS
jgi:hypothetical protein